jgi:hypothetical protein
LLSHLSHLSFQVGRGVGGGGMGSLRVFLSPPWPLLALCVLLQRDWWLLLVSPVPCLRGGGVWKLRASIMCPCW